MSCSAQLSLTRSAMSSSTISLRNSWERTIQKYMQQVRPQRARGQTWKTFLRNHAAEMWACDFLQVTDLFFRPLFAFFDTLVAVAEGHPCECDANPY